MTDAASPQLIKAAAREEIIAPILKDLGYRSAAGTCANRGPQRRPEGAVEIFPADILQDDVSLESSFLLPVRFEHGLPVLLQMQWLPRVAMRCVGRIGPCAALARATEGTNSTLDSARLGSRVPKRDLEWLSLPVRTVGTPGPP